MRFLKSIYYWIYYVIVGARIKKVLAPYLNDNSKLEISYLFQSLKITDYKLSLIKEEEIVTNYLNLVTPKLKFDKILYSSNKVIFTSEKLPEVYKPQSKHNSKNKLTIGVTEKGPYTIQTNINHCLLLGMAPGSGKTFGLRKIISTLMEYHYSPTDLTKSFQAVTIIDPKNEGDFEEHSTRAKIIISQEEALAFLTQLNEEVDSNMNKRQIIIIEEYTQLIINGDKKMGREIARIIQRINTFYRSKGIFLIMTTQFLTVEMNEVNVESFIKIISSPTKSYANLYNIPLIYCNRDDLIHGKYLINFRGKTQCIRI